MLPQPAHQLNHRSPLRATSPTTPYSLATTTTAAASPPPSTLTEPLSTGLLPAGYGTGRWTPNYSASAVGPRPRRGRAEPGAASLGGSRDGAVIDSGRASSGADNPQREPAGVDGATSSGGSGSGGGGGLESGARDSGRHGESSGYQGRPPASRGPSEVRVVGESSQQMRRARSVHEMDRAVDGMQSVMGWRRTSSMGSLAEGSVAEVHAPAPRGGYPTGDGPSRR